MKPYGIKRLSPTGAKQACWVCFVAPDEPYSLKPRAYAETPSKALAFLLHQSAVDLDLLRAIDQVEPDRSLALDRLWEQREQFADFLRASETMPVLPDVVPPVQHELSRQQGSTSEIPPLPVTMSDGLHRRVRKILDTFPFLHCKQNR